MRSGWADRGLMGATSVGCAGLGWLTLLLVARLDVPSAYASFAVLWAAYYALAGSLSGLQQEVTRASLTSERFGASKGVRLSTIIVMCGGVLALILAISFAWWGRNLGAGLPVMIPLALGALSLTMLIAVLGLLAAEGRWMTAAALLATDALLRLAAVSTAAALAATTFWYTAAVVVGSAVWLPILVSRRYASLRKRLRTRWSVGAFVSRSAAAMGATSFASLLIAGMPWLLALTAQSRDGQVSASLLAALVLFRSPVLVLVQGLRPVILRDLISDPGGMARHMRRAVLGYLVVGCAACLGAYRLGPWLLRSTFGQAFEVQPGEAAVLTASAVLLALATHVTLASAARDQHRRATEAWLVAVLVTVVVLVMLHDAPSRLLWSSVMGPIACLLYVAIGAAIAVSRESEVEA